MFKLLSGFLRHQAGKGLKTNDKGFTITEVVIVLGIIGGIAAVIFYALPALTRTANNRSRDADIKAIAAAMRDYASNHNSKLPAIADVTDGGSGNAFDYGDTKLSIYDGLVFVNALSSGNMAATTSYYGTDNPTDDDVLPDTDNIHIIISQKCIDFDSASIENSTTAGKYNSGNFEFVSKRSFTIIYKIEHPEYPYKCFNS